MNIARKKQYNNYEGTGGCIIFFTAAICILSFASASSRGAFEGLKICSDIIIPSLFPFTVLTVLFQKSGGLLWLGKKIDKITRLLFGLSGLNFSVILISLVGGYPIGAKIINELYSSDELSKSEAEKLLRFCINPSPAFFISAFGVGILKSKASGFILFIANLIACFILNLFSVGGKTKNIIKKEKKICEKNKYLSDSFVESVLEGAKITLGVCAFVTLFSSVCEMTKPLFINEKLYALFCPVLEISFGISEIKNSGIPTCFYSFFLAFGGISTIFQIKQATTLLNVSVFKIVVFRIIQGAFATALSFILFKIFPQSLAVFSSGTDIKFGGYALFFPSVMLIVFSVLFLMFLSPKSIKKHAATEK